MAEEMEGLGVGFAFIYTREAHPGEHYGPHQTFEQKLSNARDMVARFGIKRRMLVDGLDGSVHRAYRLLPNMAYVVAAGGRILYKASWTDPRSIRMAVDQIGFERGEHQRGRALLPYYVEWNPQTATDRQRFLEHLHVVAGPRAADEYIAAVAAKNVRSPMAR